MLTTTQAADILHCTRIAVLQAIRRGKLKAVKIGRDYHLKRTELMRYKKCSNEYLKKMGRIS